MAGKRQYNRDARGRFAGDGGSGGGKSRSAAKPRTKGKNRITRDNAGKITGTGNGATARGGRLKTASGKQRATQTARLKGSGSRIKNSSTRQSSNKPATAKRFNKISQTTDFNTMKRRWDRTRPENSGLTNNVDDRSAAARYSGTGRRKLLNSMSTRKRALGLYRSMASRPLNELSNSTVRAPMGRFSTVKNPAPARSFPSQAPGRTKKGEEVARANRKRPSRRRK
jgi:hypothetical protein